MLNQNRRFGLFAKVHAIINNLIKMEQGYKSTFSTLLCSVNKNKYVSALPNREMEMAATLSQLAQLVPPGSTINIAVFKGQFFKKC